MRKPFPILGLSKQYHEQHVLFLAGPQFPFRWLIWGAIYTNPETTRPNTRVRPKAALDHSARRHQATFPSVLWNCGSVDAWLLLSRRSLTQIVLDPIQIFIQLWCPTPPGIFNFLNIHPQDFLLIPIFYWSLITKLPFFDWYQCFVIDIGIILAKSIHAFW